MDQLRFVGRVFRRSKNARFFLRVPHIGIARLSLPLVILFIVSTLSGADPTLTQERSKAAKKWIATWTTAPQDVFKGSSTPALVNFAFPNPTTDGVGRRIDHYTR
jgi:hypothetical protein